MVLADLRTSSLDGAKVRAFGFMSHRRVAQLDT